MTRREHKTFFPSSKGSKLCAILTNPTGKKTSPIIILAHGFSTSKESNGIVSLAEKLNSIGISTLRIDFYGHGESEGKFEDITVSEGVDDILSALSFLKGKGYKKIGLMGSSFGGICSTLAASKTKDVFVLALKSPVSDFAEVQQASLSKKTIEEWKREGVRIYCPKRSLKLKYSFYEDALKLKVYKDAERITIPTIIVHGDKDEIVPIQQSFELVKAIKTSKLVVVKGANHRYEEKSHFELAVKLLSDFIWENIEK